MAKIKSRKDIEAAIAGTVDAPSFVSRVLIDTLQWPVPKDASVEDIAYDYTPEELGAPKLNQKNTAGVIRQIVLPGCPWGIFILEFKHPDVFTTGRGLTGLLRHLLQRLVSHGRRNPKLPSFQREHLLFICTHGYKYYRFAQFRAPAQDYKAPPLASFGWGPGDSTKTVAEYNLPHLAYLDKSGASVDDWIAAWTHAFDVERVTKKFYADYKSLHDCFRNAAWHVTNANDRPWLASVVLNRLMFIYFLQKKGFIDNGNERYLEDKLAATKKLGKNRFYSDFLSLLFFEGFAKPGNKRSEAAQAILGSIRYLNGGLFLEHPIEQAARAAGKPIDWPDEVFQDAFSFFASFSWNLNDVPGGEDNEINPDVLGYILEKYVNQKAFGAYYTRPEITNYLCERTIHRLVLDAINTKGPGVPGLPYRKFDTVPQLFKKLDDVLATRLLDDVLPNLALLDPACGSGAFLVAAMKTLIHLYAAVFSWIEFHGSTSLRGRLAQIRADHPSLDYFIKKRIITDNLFGTDIMPEAVEIARLRLFLALVASADKPEQLEPLPNIDFNIMAGNSLIGLLDVKPAAFDQGKLFGQTYEQIVAERDRRLDTYRHAGTYAEDLTSLRDGITAINDKAQQQLNDLLLDQFDDLGIKFEQATWDDATGEAGKPIKRNLTSADIGRLRPFHWAFAYSKVMRRGGFDAIVTNPPWEVFQTNEKEFFLEYEPTIQRKALRIEDWERQRDLMLRDDEVRERWLEYESRFPHQWAFFKKSGEYINQTSVIDGKAVGNKPNLYCLFVERCFRLIRPSGQCGIVIPSGIYTDLGAKGLREMLFDHAKIDGLFCIENRKAVFEDVDSRFKFVIFTFERGGTTEAFPAAFMRHDVAELEDFPNHAGVRISVDLVRKLSPSSLSISEFNSQVDLGIAEKTSAFPLLFGDRKGWNLELYGEELNMTRSSGEFLTVKTNFALYEGDMIWQFDHRYSEPRYWVNEPSLNQKFKQKRVKRIVGTVDSGTLRNDYEVRRIAIRKIASNTNERTLVAAIIPKHSLTGNSLSVHFPFHHTGDRPNTERFSSQELLCLSGLLNSLVVDYTLRLRMTTNLNLFFLYQLPIPRLASSDAGFAEIVERSAKLTCTTPEFDELAKEAGLMPPNHTAGVTDPAERAKLRANLDGIVAHLYGLTEQQFEHVLATFPLVDPAVRNDALAAYRKLIETGEAARYNPDLPKPQKPSGPIIAPADQAVLDLIAAGESKTLEFKSTARFNVKANQPDPKMERIIAKTVAAFLNTDGGTLLIGVTDEGTVRGMADDFATLKKADRDGFELWLMQTLLNDFEKDASQQISVSFHAIAPPSPDTRPGASEVCRVDATPSPRPRFVKEDGQEKFYVRTGNATNALAMKEMFTYFSQRWPGAFAGSAKER